MAPPRRSSCSSRTRSTLVTKPRRRGSPRSSRFDKKNDKVLAAFLADVLEDTFAELAKQYGFTPPGKILVEVFARRQIFSGRIALLPGIPGAVQGACTGPLVALPSPAADGGK